MFMRSATGVTPRRAAVAAGAHLEGRMALMRPIF